MKKLVPDTTTPWVVTPGTPMTPVEARKRKHSIGSEKVDQLPMLERLRLLSKDGSQSVTTPPKTDSLLQLLLQGLHNKDRKILDSVLDRTDENLIETTVRKLPIEGVIPLIQELQHYIRGRGMTQFTHGKWLNSVLQHHSAYLMSNPDCADILCPVLSMLEARTKHFDRILRLKGKLDTMTRQISSAGQTDLSPEEEKEALLVHRDSDSDLDADVLDELLPPASDIEEYDEDEDEDDEDMEDEDEDEQEEEMMNGVEEENEDDEEESSDSD